MEKGKELLKWDATILEDEVMRRMSRIDFEKHNDVEKEIRDQVYNDKKFWLRRWRRLMKGIQEFTTEVNPLGYWKIEKVGETDYRFKKSAEELLNLVLPHSRCTFWIWRFGRGFLLRYITVNDPDGVEISFQPISPRTYTEGIN